MQHYAVVTDPVALGQLMRAIRSYKGTAIVRAALQFVPLRDLVAQRVLIEDGHLLVVLFRLAHALGILG